jgi:hypothetical protein
LGTHQLVALSMHGLPVLRFRIFKRHASILWYFAEQWHIELMNREQIHLRRGCATCGVYTSDAAMK